MVVDQLIHIFLLTFITQITVRSINNYRNRLLINRILKKKNNNVKKCIQLSGTDFSSRKFDPIEII